jgi:xanthine/uracil permease
MKTFLMISVVLMFLMVSTEAHAQIARATQSTTVPWWSGQQAGLVGGIAGAVAGILGGLIGCLGGLGRTRRVALALMFGLAGVGVLALAVGVVALLGGQPYHVFFPPLLIGLVVTVTTTALIPVVIQRIRADENQRMAAADGL